MKLNKIELLDALRSPEELKRLRNVNRVKLASDPPESQTEKNMSEWLGRLKLMHGVPFNYLVPNTDMLPEESIRFFYVDVLWLDYLQEGAMSIGRSTSSQEVHDQSFSEDISFMSRHGMRSERERVLGHLLNHLHPSAKAKLAASASIPVDEKVTGFLLRSGVVSGWEGLEVEAFYDVEQTNPATLLRMDHLSPNVLFCMYEGEVKSFRIHEHPEVLHFGVDLPTEKLPVLSKSFRYIVDVDGHKAGKDVSKDIAKPLEVPEYERVKGSRVMRINKFATAMHDELKNTIGYQGPFTAAGFALEMVEGVQAVNFQIKY